MTFIVSNVTFVMSQEVANVIFAIRAAITNVTFFSENVTFDTNGHICVSTWPKFDAHLGHKCDFYDPEASQM